MRIIFAISSKKGQTFKIDREEIIILHKSLDSALSNFVDKRMNKYISQLTID